MAAVSFLAANTSTTAEVNRLWIQTPANTSRIQGTLTQNPAAFAEIDDIFDVSDPPWENAKGVCLKKFSKALPQKAFITKGI